MLIAHVSNRNFQQIGSDIFDEFQLNYGKIIRQKCQCRAIEEFNGVHAECRIYHKYGFVDLNWLLIIIAATQAIFQQANFSKMYKNCAYCKISDNHRSDYGLCLKPHQ